MSDLATKASLSPPRRRLLELMEQIGFGRIEGLAVRDGEPAFDPAPRVVRQIKLGRENGPRPQLGAKDITLKRQVVEFFDYLTRLGHGVVQSLDIKHGLPFLMNVEETVPVRSIDTEAQPAPRDPFEQEFLRESEAFERLLPGLLQTRTGRFVAVHNGRIIDEDEDEFALAERIERGHRSEFVLIRRVSTDAIEDRFESPEVEMP